MKIIILLASLILTEFVDSTKDNKIYRGIVTVSGETFNHFYLLYNNAVRPVICEGCH
jgi:hypothetical protein